jgi:hypothetical protein
MTPVAMTSPPKRFRVALSFPGEHRAFVGDVAEALAARVGRERILYDKYYEGEFARTDLDTHLQRLYHNESDLIAVFLSVGYDQSDWCRLEWRAVRDLIKRRRPAEVMPLRFDDTEIPGLFSTDGYVSIRDRRPEEIAALILQRLETLGDLPPTPLPPFDRKAKLSSRRVAILLSGASVFVALVAWLSPLRHSPAQRPTIRIRGTIMDQTRRPVVGASVGIRYYRASTTQSDSNGRYDLLIDLRQGDDNVWFEVFAPSHDAWEEQIAISSNRITHDVTLGPKLTSSP